MLPTFSSGRSLAMRLMDASSAFTDGGTGGRVLSFSRAETARPTVNQGGGASLGRPGSRGGGLGTSNRAALSHKGTLSTA